MKIITLIDPDVVQQRYNLLLKLMTENEMGPDRYSSLALLMASMSVARIDGSTKEAYMKWAELTWDSMRDSHDTNQN